MRLSAFGKKKEPQMRPEPGDVLPDGCFGVMTASGPGSIDTRELFSGKKVVLFSVPGAFTPTCSREHLPGFIEKAAVLRQHGVDTIACTAVNDIFVMAAWAKEQMAGDEVLMLADGNADYVRKLDLELDGTAFGLGIRGQRFAMIVDDGVLQVLLVDDPGTFEATSAASILEHL
jgi:peroxiredoxin